MVLAVNVLLTGSSGWLGRALAPRLRTLGHHVIGLDPVIAPDTRVVGTVADAKLVRETCREYRIDAIVHAGALHKPQVATHPADAFEDEVPGRGGDAGFGHVGADLEDGGHVPLAPARAEVPAMGDVDDEGAAVGGEDVVAGQRHGAAGRVQDRARRR